MSIFKIQLSKTTKNTLGKNFVHSEQNRMCRQRDNVIHYLLDWTFLFEECGNPIFTGAKKINI